MPFWRVREAEASGNPIRERTEAFRQESSMKYLSVERASWSDVLHEHKPLLLPAAHDALTARLIQLAGFPAYQIGGFALVGAMHAVPDIDLEHFGENSAAAREIIEASPLPVLVDGDNGYGDVKNVTRTIQGYEDIGASAIFIEDQKSPKKCGHMANKEVIPAEEMVAKVRAAVAARSDSRFFIMARTDALGSLGVKEAIERAKRYLDAGADGAYVEGPTNTKELETIGRELGDVPLAVSVLEGGGKTPWLPPAEFSQMGFSMLLYPTTVLFRLTRTIQAALTDLKLGKPMSKDAVNMDQFEQIVDIDHWKEIEKEFQPEARPTSKAA